MLLGLPSLLPLAFLIPSAAFVRSTFSMAMRAAIERVGALAGLRFDELGDDREALGFGEPGDRRALRLDTEPRALLLPSSDTIIGNGFFHTKGIPPFALCMNAQSEQ